MAERAAADLDKAGTGGGHDVSELGGWLIANHVGTRGCASDLR
jgi:hypothetical protein